MVRRSESEKTSPIQRFWDLTGSSRQGCWNWEGAKNRGGYGGFMFATQQWTFAHRFIYEHTFGRIDEGMVIDHLCRNPSCVNPYHMDVVTSEENVRRGSGPTAVNGRKSRCIRGHVLDESNTYLKPNGIGRECRACKRVRWRERYRDVDLAKKRARWAARRVS